MTKSKTKRSKPLHIIIKILGMLIPIGLMYWIFFIKIPSQVSYADVWATIEQLSFAQNFALLLAGLLTIVVYGWTSATVLPGLSLRKGTQSAVSGQLTSVVLPAPIDLAIRFSMYQSYGFSTDKSTVAVGLAGIARYFTVFVMPLFGLAALVFTGQPEGHYFFWLLLGVATILSALWIMSAILRSTKTATRVGRIFQAIIKFAYRIVRRKNTRDIVGMTVDFGARTHDVAINYFKSIALSNIAWGFSCYLALLLAIRFVGIDNSVMSAAYVLLITGVMLLLNAFPITPGGIGVTETILVALIPFPNSQVQAAFLSALFLYRIYTWLLPMPVGLVAYGSWRRNHKITVKPA